MTRNTSIPDTMTIHVPFRVVKRGGRKEMVLPEGAAQAPKPDSLLHRQDAVVGGNSQWRKGLARLQEKELVGFPFLSVNATGIEVFRWREELVQCFPLVTGSTPNARSREVRRISGSRERVRQLWRGRQCSAPPA